MSEAKKSIRQFENFEGRFMSIKIGISKDILDLMTDEDRMTLGSMVSGFEGDMFGLLKEYGEIANAERISEETSTETNEETSEETSTETPEEKKRRTLKSGAYN